MAKKAKTKKATKKATKPKGKAKGKKKQQLRINYKFLLSVKKFSKGEDSYISFSSSTIEDQNQISSLKFVPLCVRNHYFLLLNIFPKEVPLLRERMDDLPHPVKMILNKRKNSNRNLFFVKIKNKISLQRRLFA